MTPKLLFRIAAVTMLLHTIGHTIGALTWKKAPDAAVAAVIAGMQDTHFQFMGRNVTIAGFYSGYGICMIFVLLFTSALLWLLSLQAKGMLAMRIAVMLGLFLLFLAIAEYIYFFPMAAAFSLIAGICTLWAGTKISNDQSE